MTAASRQIIQLGNVEMQRVDNPRQLCKHLRWKVGHVICTRWKQVFQDTRYAISI